MDAKELPDCQMNEFVDNPKSVIANAPQAAVDDMSTKHQPIPTVNVLALPSDTNNAPDSVQVLHKIVNSAVPIRVIKNTFTDVTQFPTIGHLLDDIRTAGSFVTFTDMTLDALQVQEINLDTLRGVEAVKELTKVPETELVDFKVEVQMDFEAEQAKLTESEQLKVQANETMDFKAEDTKETEPELLMVKEKEVETIVDIHTTTDEDDDNSDNAQETMSTSSHTDSNDRNYGDKAMPTPKKKYNLKRESVINIESLVLFMCPECGYNADNFDDWKNHTNKLHQFNTVEKINMRSVQTIYKGKLGFECRLCSARYTRVNSSSGELITHHIFHLPFGRYVKCRVCDQSYTQLRCAKRHIRLCHPLHCSIEKLKQDKQKLSPMNYLHIHCPTCNEKQSNIDHWNEHMKQHDFFAKCEQQVKPIAGNKYECNICLKHFRKCFITDHMLHHEPYKPFKCTLCEKYESIKQCDAVDHVRNAHLFKAVVIKCEYCDATFNIRKNYVRHKSKYHKEESKKCFGSCLACNMEFASLTKLIEHLHSSKHNKNVK